MKLAVLGAGAWGTAISISLAARHAVTLWARDAGLVSQLAATRGNQRYLPGFTIPDAVGITGELAAALDGCDLILVATTTAGLRPVLRQLTAAGNAAPLVWLCKGFETESARLPHQVAAAELPANTQCAVLSGPSFAQEVAQGLPTALTLASEDPGFAERTARELHHERLRVYSSDDVIGVEVAGAVKNVMAIAAGICDGLGLGHNARAALITRGLAEITRLGLRLGGRLETFMGLAGAGDLILTCTGDLSRNRTVGLRLAHGIALDQVLRGLGHVAEGVYTAREVDRLARDLGVEMPITRAVCRVMDEGIPPAVAVRELLQRDPKAEHR
ncbi:MAG: NAD(P)-dependent glycerol-3-phosphate dehydrogenase [Betaproteobacteria bacterium]|nr:NAD(P)-dependent glycerol-3-phosphate dehydrogenase [Betaproteobacteria bacterium]